MATKGRLTCQIGQVGSLAGLLVTILRQQIVEADTQARTTGNPGRYQHVDKILSRPTVFEPDFAPGAEVG